MQPDLSDVTLVFGDDKLLFFMASLWCHRFVANINFKGTLDSFFFEARRSLAFGLATPEVMFAVIVEQTNTAPSCRPGESQQDGQAEGDLRAP